MELNKYFPQEIINIIYETYVRLRSREITITDYVDYILVCKKHHENVPRVVTFDGSHHKICSLFNIVRTCTATSGDKLPFINMCGPISPVRIHFDNYIIHISITSRKVQS